MTFTSLEPIFCHYAKNHDSSQPGEKDNTFLYEAYDNLPHRIKYTGWEKSSAELIEGTEFLRKECNYAFQTFLTWRNSTLRYKKESNIAPTRAGETCLRLKSLSFTASFDLFGSFDYI